MEGAEESLAGELRERLVRAVAGCKADGLLFSGGLDSAVLASILARTGREVTAVTVTLEGSGEDLDYARMTADSLGIRHHHISVTTDEALSAIPEIIRITDSFDPALPNDVVVYFGVACLRAQGCTEVMTGDGADEIFGGYDFMHEMSRLDAGKYIERIAPRMSFTSPLIAEDVRLRISQPFTDQRIVDFALKTPIGFKIREQGGRTVGKWLLRKAFEDLLPPDVVWQGKRPLEYGSGMTRMREAVTEMVPDEEYGRSLCPVRFISKEHYYYYKVYNEVAGPIPKPRPEEVPCPGCGAGMPAGAFHCRICGYVADWRKA